MSVKNNMTRSGIVYDITNTPYTVTINYDENQFTYHFSSQLYLDKFNERIVSNRKRIESSLTKRFNFNIANDVLADLNNYTKVEKRGFLITSQKERFICLSTIKLDGKNLTNKN